MALLAVAVPILSGKTAQWRRFTDELNGPRRRDYEESRRRLGVHERGYSQSTPQGDLVIVAVEGDDPAATLNQFGKGTDDLTR